MAHRGKKALGGVKRERKTRTWRDGYRMGSHDIQNPLSCTPDAHTSADACGESFSSMLSSAHTCSNVQLTHACTPYIRILETRHVLIDALHMYVCVCTALGGLYECSWFAQSRVRSRIAYTSNVRTYVVCTRARMYT